MSRPGLLTMPCKRLPSVSEPANRLERELPEPEANAGTSLIALAPVVALATADAAAGLVSDPCNAAVTCDAGNAPDAVGVTGSAAAGDDVSAPKNAGCVRSVPAPNVDAAWAAEPGAASPAALDPALAGSAEPMAGAAPAGASPVVPPRAAAASLVPSPPAVVSASALPASARPPSASAPRPNAPVPSASAPSAVAPASSAPAPAAVAAASPAPAPTAPSAVSAPTPAAPAPRVPTRSVIQPMIAPMKAQSVGGANSRSLRS